MTWLTVTYWIDLATGEVLTKDEAKKYFATIERKKSTTFKTNNHGIKTSGTISIVNLCRRKPEQLKAF